MCVYLAPLDCTKAHRRGHTSQTAARRVLHFIFHVCIAKSLLVWCACGRPAPAPLDRRVEVNGRASIASASRVDPSGHCWVFLNIGVSELLVQYIIERHRLYTTLLFSSVSWLLRFFQDRHGLWEGRPSQLKKCNRTTCSFIRLETI